MACLPTSAREALVRGFDVSIDPHATDARALDHNVLGRQAADDVRRSALLHLAHMGVAICPGRSGLWWMERARRATRARLDVSHAEPRFTM